MKNRLIALLIGTVAGMGATAQNQVPTYSSLDPLTSTTAQKADNAWLMGGNLSSPNGRNIFGTTSNSVYTNNMPIYTVTNGSLRMKLNATYTTTTNQYTVNGYGYGSGPNFINTSGFLLLGHNGSLVNNPNTEALYNTKGAFSMLHLNGDRNSGQHVQEEGFRPWMKVGITFTSNNDLSYIGHRRMGADDMSDITDMVIGWSNDPTNNNSSLGGDNLVFTFLSGTSASNNGIYGTEIGRFTPSCTTCPVKKGSFGIGSFDPSTSQGPGTSGYVGATLDVDGDARIRTVTEKNLNQVLVRDPNDLGRIYWRDASTFTGGGGNFGNACGGTSNPLTADHEVPMNGYNFHFTDPATLYEGHDQVTVGSSGCNILKAKFNVIANQKTDAAEHSIGLYVEENNQASNANNLARTTAGYLTVQQHNVTNDGVYGYAGDAVTNYGGRFESDQPYTNNQPAYNERNYGVVGYASNGAQTIGVEGTAQDAGNPLTDKVMGGNFEALGGSQTCYGVRATSASNGIDTYGGNFEGVGNGSTSYGIYAAAWGSATSLYAGYFNGDVFGSGTGVFIGSDTKLKKNVEDMESATEILSKLSPKKYEYKIEDYPQMQLPKGEHYGFIAQELEEVLPQAVKNTIHPAQKNNEGEIVHEAVDFKAVNYQALIPILVKGLQEQSEKISQLEERLNACCAASKTPETSEISVGTVIQTRLQNADEPSLGQNIPNPFETSTRVPVYLPQNTGKAELLFYGNDGRVLQTVQISERGNVQVDVNSEALASGIYSYTLFTEGKPIATRKMVKR